MSAENPNDQREFFKNLKMTNDGRLLVSGIAGGGPGSGWTRNSEWITHPDLDGLSDKITGVFAVRPNDESKNILAFEFDAPGGYTIDFGDGNVIAYGDGEANSHTYDFADLAAGTTTTEGYRQALVTITPNSTFDGQVSFIDNSVVGNIEHNWLEVFLCVPNATYFNNNFSAPMCENVRLFGTTPSISFDAFLPNFPRLQNIELDWTKPTSFNYPFSYMSLASLGDINSANEASYFRLTNITNYSIKEIGNLTINNGIQFNTYAVETIGNYTDGGTNMPSVFENFYLLRNIGTVTINNATEIDEFFRECVSLLNINIVNTSSLFNISTIAYNCNSLKSFVLSDASGITNTSNAFFRCLSMNECRLPDIAVSFNVTDASLSRDAIVDLFNDLDTAVGQTITITGNPGVPDLTAPDLAIATGKGWTVAS